MKHLFCIFVLFTTTSCYADKPNVLWISVDDLNDWVGYLEGHPQVKTANIDRLVKRGIAFTNAHCTTPLCNPSRSAILSGLSENTTEMHYKKKFKYDPEKYNSLPNYFADNGYMTYGTGKIHHRKINKDLFQEYFDPEQRWSPFDPDDLEWLPEEVKTKGTTDPRHVIKKGPGGKTYVLPMSRMPSERRLGNTDADSFDWGGFDLPDEAFGDGKAANWVIEKIHQHKGDKPFVIGLGLYRPHIPLYAPQKYFDMHPLESIKLPDVPENDLDDLPASAMLRVDRATTADSHKFVMEHGGKQKWKEGVQAYLACVSFADAQIGKVLDCLEQSPYADNTIIVLLGDHGWHLGEKGCWGKLTTWVHATKVPFIICPAGSKKGALCHEPVSLLDIYPTLVDMAGLPKKKLDGISLVPLLKNPQLNTQRVVKTHVGEGTYALSGKTWRYIQYKEGGGELYNMVDDPREYQNLIKDSKYKSVVQDLEKRVR